MTRYHLVLRRNAPLWHDDGCNRDRLPIDGPAPRPCSAVRAVPHLTSRGSLNGQSSVLFSSTPFCIVLAYYIPGKPPLSILFTVTASIFLPIFQFTGLNHRGLWVHHFPRNRFFLFLLHRNPFLSPLSSAKKQKICSPKGAYSKNYSTAQMSRKHTCHSHGFWLLRLCSSSK